MPKASDRAAGGSQPTADSSEGWIDLHTHILPGLDDGAQDLAQALAMARIAQADGIGALVATPHNVSWPARDHRPEIESATRALNEAIEAAGLRVVVLPGVEAYLTPDICRQVKIGQAFALAHSAYILVELPASAYPLYTEQAIFELQVMGLSVILAHPERNAVIEREPARLVPLVERGVLVQLTAASIVGAFGPEVQQTAHYLLRSKLAHVIASDAHGTGYRSPALREAVEIAGGLIGAERAAVMVDATPRAVLGGRPIEVEAPELARPEKKRLWSRLFAGK
jgi:protein-tyrosine phosphatase